MARNDGVDRTTVRNQPRTESNIADARPTTSARKPATGTRILSPSAVI